MFQFFKYKIYSLNLEQQLRFPSHQEMQETFGIKTSNSEKQYIRGESRKENTQLTAALILQVLWQQSFLPHPL